MYLRRYFIFHSNISHLLIKFIPKKKNASRQHESRVRDALIILKATPDFSEKETRYEIEKKEG